MRRAHAVDANQPAIVDWARKLGFSVTVTSQLGNGFTDLALGKYGLTFLAEVKDPAKPPSKRRLTPDELEWHNNWLGHKCILQTSDDVVELHDYARCLAEKIGILKILPPAIAEGALIDNRIRSIMEPARMLEEVGK